MSRNPFVVNCLNKHPLVSSNTACMMETAWDAAIEAVLLAKDEHGKISVGKVKALKSTNQRQTGPDVRLDPSRVPTSDRTAEELDNLLTADPAKHNAFHEALKGGRIPAIKLLREWFACSLKSGVDYCEALARVNRRTVTA
jgi:hypothetical protein